MPVSYTYQSVSNIPLFYYTVHRMRWRERERERGKKRNYPAIKYIGTSLAFLNIDKFPICTVGIHKNRWLCWYDIFNTQCVHSSAQTNISWILAGLKRLPHSTIVSIISRSVYSEYNAKNVNLNGENLLMGHCSSAGYFNASIKVFR